MSSVLATASNDFQVASPGTPSSAPSDASTSSSPSLSPVPTPSTTEQRALRMQRHSVGTMMPVNNGTAPVVGGYHSPLVMSVASATSPCPSPTMSDAGATSKRSLGCIARPRPRAISTGQMKVAGILPPRPNTGSPMIGHVNAVSSPTTVQTPLAAQTGGSLPSSLQTSPQPGFMAFHRPSPQVSLLDLPTEENDPNMILKPVARHAPFNPFPTSPSVQELEKEFLH